MRVRSFWAAAALLALAGPALAQPLSRQEMIDLGACAYTTGIFLQSLEEGSPSDADRALGERAQDALMGAGRYYDQTGRSLDPDAAEALQSESRDPIDARLARYSGRKDRAEAVRGEFRPDIEACATRYEALVLPTSSRN